MTSRTKSLVWQKQALQKRYISIVVKIFMALFAHSSYALRQLELFNVPRNVDLNLRASLR